MTKLRDLKTGDKFWFADSNNNLYEYRGNGWYSGPPYSGGPWHDETNLNVDTESAGISANELTWGKS